MLDASKKLKTVFVLPSFSAGGAERVLINLMNGLDTSRFSPAIISVLEKGTLESLIRPDIPREVLAAKGIFRALPTLYLTLKKQRPDIVISTMAHMNFTVLLLRPLFPDTIFIVREAITPSFILDGHPAFAPFIRAVYKILYRMADVVVAPSRVIFGEFEKMGMSARNFQLLYNPVPQEKLDAIRPWDKSSMGFRSDEIVFVASGRLHPQKGFDRLIQSMHGMPIHWHILILGDGEERGHLESLIAKNNLQRRITLVGHKDNPWEYYKAADCFLLPSRWEGLPNVALESLACGTCVIALSEAGGIGEIAANTEKGAVYVAHDMRQFLDEMKRVSPKKQDSQSLLPAAFQEKNIIKEFTEVLEDAVKARR